MVNDYILVMRIPNPGECACDASSHRQVRNNAHNEHGVVIVLVVDENKSHTEDEPCEARCCAA